jgi:tetratricopeptide (TPR) repeat protein
MQRGWTARLTGGCLAVLIALATAQPAAVAQAVAAVQIDRQALVQGLQAQYEVSLIRERKMADDRETQMIGALEARLRAARAQADSAKSDARAARAVLATARADYAQLAGQIAGRDPGAQADIAAYGRETERETADASAEKLAALQRFADGDRVAAWSQLKSIIDAEDATAPAARRAANLRELAGLRDIMRAHGEASTAEVLDLYDKAVELDPTVFRAEMARLFLAHDLGDLTRARAAGKQALGLAVNDNERAEALKAIGDQAADQADNKEAANDFDQALTMFQRANTANPTPYLENFAAGVMEDQGDLAVRISDFQAARSHYEAALAIRRRLAGAEPTNGRMQNYLTQVLQRIGDLDMKLGDLAGAKAAYEEGLGIRQRLSAADTTNTDLQYDVSAFLRRLGDVAFQARDLATARKAYEDVLAVRQRLFAANPSSGQLKNAIALDFFDIGEVAFAQNDVGAAREAYEKSFAMREELAAADPTNADLQQLILRVMVRLASTNDPRIGWQDVAGQYRKIKEAGHLVPGDERVLIALQKRGLAGGL